MTILHIDSSIQGELSASRTLSAAVVARLRADDPGAAVVYRDLAADPLPHLTLADLAAPSPALQEFLAADTVVVGVPMYNFGIPSQLKAWFDRILAAGQTFRYTATGPEGLAGGKRVIVAIARGGMYGGDTPGAAIEHAEAYVRGALGFIGITDPEVIVAEGLKVDDATRIAALDAALSQAGRGLAFAA